ncbi:MAG: PqqD family protein [Rhodospirillales bacterium]|nr:PqqD family protein [Rhodospirillales bacterium]
MKRSDNCVMQNIGGEHVLVPLGAQVVGTNGLVILNKSARCIWEVLAEDRSVDELATAVAEQFDADPERVLADVHVFLNGIAQMALIEE